jgi:hypothetical protein
MQTKAPVRRRNGVFDHLSDSDSARIEPLLKSVELTSRQKLQGAHRRSQDVYFPARPSVSRCHREGERKQAEVALIDH